MRRPNNVKTLLLFEFLYKAAFLMLISQTFQGALKFLLKVNGYSYLTMENLLQFLGRPVTIAVIVLLLFLYAFFYLIEAVAMIVFYQGYVKQRKLQVTQILFPGIREALYLLKKKGAFAVMIYSLINAVVVMAPMLLAFSIRLKVPAYVARVVVNRTLGMGAIIGLAAVCLFFYFFGLYALYYCVLGENGFWKGYRESVKLIKKNFLRFLFRLVGVNLLLAAVYLVIYIAVLFLVCYILYRTKEEAVRVAAMLTAYDEILLYMGVFIAIANQIANYIVLSSYFYKNGMQVIYARRVEGLQELIAYEEEEQWMEYSERNTLRKRMHGWYTRATALMAAAILLVNAISLYDAFQNGSLADKETLFGTYITAHRGYSAKAPENTLPALEMAIENMADYAEIDLQETKDGVIILMHDSNLRRTTGVNAEVSSLTYEEIQKLDAGRWFSEDFAGTKVPTLQEAIELCKGKINLNMELKATRYTAKNEELVQKVVAIIKEYHLEAQCVISSTDPAMLAMVKAQNDEIKTGHILAFAYGSFYNKDYVDFFSMKSSFVNERLVRIMHGLGKEVHAWTVNSRSEMERMKLLGVDNLITDRAVLAREVVYGENAKLSFFRMLGILQE